ncbi:hypothetical protein Tsubulata_009520 [Turnera subulata]|uniref:Uncharacterized protein n=1 Tax=Turnera subulata TaxID=218843 RepID=A0A9Q0FJ10_9ROSI|nr:hypothetical protein Tsubulata_009520 [Turnera subulata]
MSITTRYRSSLDAASLEDPTFVGLEDNVWDEISASDDHIVPHPAAGHWDQFGVQGDSRKKLRLDDPILGEKSNAVSDNAYRYPLSHITQTDNDLRSCDSTFGLESLGNEDDLCWFSSSRSTEASDDALKLDSKCYGIKSKQGTKTIQRGRRRTGM